MKEENTATRLKTLMKERNLKQVDILNMVKPFCKKYGVKLEKNDLSQYISGKVIPSQKKLTILAEALNVSEVWLMGYDVPIDIDEKDCLNFTELDKFLNGIDYNDIETIVKNDNDKKIVSYIDFYSILLHIYSDKTKEYIEYFIREFEKYYNCFNDITEIIDKAKKEHNFSDSGLDIRVKKFGNSINSDLMTAKKIKLFLMIKKYYSREELLDEFDKRLIWTASNEKMRNKRARYKHIESFLDYLLESLDTNTNNLNNN